MKVINLFGQFMKLSKQKINFLTLIFFFIFSSLNLRVNCNEDTWTYTWTNHHDFSNDIDIDSKDSIYVVGKTIHSNDDHDICLLKYNKSGDLIWDQIWNQEGDQSGRALAIDKYDNVYIVGTINYYKDVIVIKCDSELNPLWNLTLDGFKDPIPSLSIEIDSLDNIYIASYTPNYDIFLVKFNSSGSQLWNSTWGTLEHIEFIDMAIDNLDNIYVLGRSENFYASYLVKFNSFGIEIWNTTTYDYEFNPRRLAIDFENNIICVTNKQLQKINSSGDLIWSLNLTKYSEGLELAVDSYGNIYFAETRMSECPPIDHFLFDGIFSYMTCFAIFTKKFSSTGEFLWEKRCTGCSSNSASGIAFDSMNNVYICGVLLIDSLGHIRNDFILFKNPVNVPGICIPIYYDLIIVIATAASLAIIIPTFKYLKKRKLRKDK